MICFARGRTRCFARSLLRRTFIMFSIPVTMMSVAGIMPMSSPAKKCYKLVLFGHLYKGMRIFGARLVTHRA